jgi:MFS family permease
VRRTLGAGGPWLLAGLFAALSAAFFAVFGFLPSLLLDRLAVGPAAGSALTAVAVAASAAGCLLCGRLLARGVRPSRILLTGFGAMALCGFGIFGGGVAGGIASALCVDFSFIGGLIPVVLIDGAPRHAPRPELVGATVGFLLQGNNAGLVLGPAAAATTAAAAGWPAVSLPVVAIAVAAGLRVLALRTQAAEQARMA